MVRNKFLIASVATMILALTFFGIITASSQNPTQLENANPGTAAWLLTNPAPNNEIAGYANLTSVNKGGQISLFFRPPILNIKFRFTAWVIIKGSAAD